MGIFKHDDAIILGWLCSEYFLAPDSTNIYGSYGNDYGVSWSDDFPSTGSGNFPVGEAGKKAYATNDNASLCGSGGSIYGGGLGQKYGTFGLGGNGTGYTSSGGGGGFYGGGSSYVFAGGGGGASYIWDGDYSIKEGYMDITDYEREQGILDYDPLLYRGLGVDALLVGFNYGKWHQKDICFNDGELQIKQVSLSDLYRAGQIGMYSMVSKFTFPATYSPIYTVIDRLTGKTVEIDETKLLKETHFNFDFGYKTITIPRTGFYLIKGLGAQGGGSSGGNDPYDMRVGGAGAWCQDVFLLPKGLVLHILVGQKGRQIRTPQRPQGGGGGAGSYSGFAGGGATAVYLEAGNLYSRLLVAGGGGGAGGTGTSNDNLDLNGNGKNNNPNENKEKDDAITTGKQMFIISDLSIAYVDLVYKCSYDIEVGHKIKVNLYVDGVYRGTQETEAIAGGSSYRFTYDNFDEWLAPNTKPYWAVLEAVVITDLPQFIIPPKGLIISVKTKKRPNDEDAILNKIFGLFSDSIRFKDFISVFFKEIGGQDLAELKYLSNKVSFYDAVKIALKNIIKLKNIIFNTYTIQDTISIILKNIAPTPGGDLRDLRYLTNRTGINDYVAIFFKEQKNVKNDVLSIAGIKDYITVNLKTVTKNKIEVIDKINIKSNIKIEEE